MSGLNIVLYEPEIPSNTGNIGRTCVATGTRLHLIEPLGFRLNEKTVRRAGMDYWEHLDVTRYDDWTDFLERNPGAKIYMATTKAKHVYTEGAVEPACPHENVGDLFPAFRSLNQKGDVSAHIFTDS